MTGENEITVTALMDMHVGGRRWTRLFQGAPDDPELREIMLSIERLAEDMRKLFEGEPEEERWYDGMYRR